MSQEGKPSSTPPELDEKATHEKLGHEKSAAGAPDESSDVEKAGSIVAEGGKLQRQMKSRHIAMISIGGVIGTGLFLGTASSLRTGGPIGLLLGYTIVGSICYTTMVSLGEMIAYLPIGGGHISLAERFVDKSFAFTMGWNYWYNWTIILPAELSAAAILINYWNKDINNAVWITICMVVVIIINLLGAGVYGECEFVFASIKVITITGLIILGIVLDLGGGPDHFRRGFWYWIEPGPFVQYNNIPGDTGKFLGWWSVMTQAAFSFIGTEIVAIAAGEAKNPRRNIPRAIKRVYIRILLFYILGTFVIGILVPSNHPSLKLTDKNAAASPFVIAIQEAGISGLPSVINAALLTSAWSAASSDLYTSSRALYGLSIAGQAPKVFSKISRSGLPWVSVAFCALFSALAYMGIDAGAGKVFGWFANMTSVAGLMTWFGISLTYIRFHAGMKAQGIERKNLPYSSPLQPYAAWYSLIFCLVICFFSGWTVFLAGNWVVADFITNYLPLALFPMLYIGAKFFNKDKLIPASEMDFVSGLAEIEADSYDEPPPRNFAERFWSWLM